jgi:signal transduction histidine kinase
MPVQSKLAVSMYGVLLSAAAALATLIAWRAERLVDESAERAILAETGRRNLALLLRDHHDVRTLLSSATIGCELAQRALKNDDAQSAAAQLERLRSCLKDINAVSREIREMSLPELLAQEDLASVRLADIAERLTALLPLRHPRLRITVDMPRLPDPLFTGGRAALERAICRLVDNAAEGDGTRRATSVRISASFADPFLLVFVDDDGPGFDAQALLFALDTPRRSTKPDGTGTGLFLVGSAVRACGGAILLANQPEGGARVTLRLPIAVMGAEPARSVPTSG